MIYNITEIRARYVGTNKIGVTYHGSYTTWLEVAWLNYIPKLGFSYADMEKQGVISPVTDLNVNYKKSVFYPKKVRVKAWAKKYSRLRSVYKYEIFNKKSGLAITGSTESTCIKEDIFKPIRLDYYFPDWHEAYSKMQTLSDEGETIKIMDGIDSL